MADDKTTVQNVGQPGKTYRVNTAKYQAMKSAVLAVLPSDALGMDVPALVNAVKPLLPADLFPDGSTAGWWVKSVQLDLEATEFVADTTASSARCECFVRN